MLKARNSAVITAQTVWLPISSGLVSQQPFRKNPVIGLLEHTPIGPPSTLRARTPAGTATGFVERHADPLDLTNLFTNSRDNAAMSKRTQSTTMAIANTFAFSGIEAVPVEVQVQIAPGAPGSSWSGLPDKAVGEARERVRAAFAAMSLSLPLKRVLVNLKPADIPKEGSHFDLPLALGLLAAMEVLPRDEIAGYAALGELSLDGSLNPVAGVLPAAIGASARDWGLICPAGQGGEAAWAGRIEVLAPRDLLALINHFRGTQVLTPPQTAGVAEAAACPDLRDVKGMETARRAVEIAAAGGHNLLLVGPPGAGKSMLAARLPGLLPDLDPRIRAGGQHDPLASPACWMAGGW